MLLERLPKVELHAHLSGSVSTQTLSEIMQRSKQETELSGCVVKQFDSRKLSDCFKLFKVLHTVLNNERAVTEAVQSVIRDFAADRVMYLEIRSTLRPMPTLAAYLQNVLVSIATATPVTEGIIRVNFLASIDRGRPETCAEETIQAVLDLLASDFPHKHLLVGIDLSGDPNHAKPLSDFARHLDAARQRGGLKTAVHLAEVPGRGEEWRAFLERHIPDRIGHATNLIREAATCQDALFCLELIKRECIPIEACLSSNIKCGSVVCCEEHHFIDWLKLEHPVFLCTDDKGVFQTSLSEEFKLAQRTWDLSHDELAKTTKYAIEASFASPETKELLKREISISITNEKYI